MAAYDSVNGAWGRPRAELPPITEREAITACKRLYRLAFKKPFTGKVKITSGNRYTYIRRGILYVNPDRGWWDVAHGMSHYASFRLYPGKKPHSHQHAHLERTIIEHIVSSGWLDGKLKRPEKTKAPVNVRAVRAARVALRIEAWTRKLKRAQTALRTLQRKARYYDRVTESVS